MNEVNLANFCHHIEKEIQENGFYYNKKAYSPHGFFLIASKLGNCESFSEIKIDRKSKIYINQPKTVPLHTDSPLIKYIGWHCIKQDEIDGSSILSDGYKVLSDLDEHHIKIIKMITIHYPDCEKNKFLKTSVLTEKNNKKMIYYAPWLLEESAYKDTLDFFNENLLKHAFSVRLDVGEILFVDNKRMLHGRDPISENSVRVLRRVWIS